MSKVPWTEPEDGQLIAAWQDTAKTNREVAASLGRTIDSCRHRARWLKLGNRPPLDGAWVWSPERIEQARDLFMCRGYSAADVAQKMGVGSKGAITGLADRLGWRKAASTPRKTPAKPGTFSMPRYEGNGRNPVERALLAASANAAARAEPRPGCYDGFTPLPGVQPVPFLSRGAGQCRWPVGGEGADMLCCGADAAGLYCAPHELLSMPRPGAKEALDKRLGIAGALK